MHQHGYIGRKLKQPELRAEPAVVLVTFGTSNRSREPLALFDRALEVAPNFQEAQQARRMAAIALSGQEE